MQHLADMTAPMCGACPLPYSCCEAQYCRDAMAYAAKHWGESLQPTGHPTLPLMGPKGCTAAPHLRPKCTVFVCPEHRGNEFTSAAFGAVRMMRECGKG